MSSPNHRFRTLRRPGRRGFAALVTVAGMIASAAYAAPADNLATMIDQALSNNADSRLAALDNTIADARLKRANAAARPRLDLTISNDVTSIYDPFTGVVATAVIGGQPISVDVTRSAPRSAVAANLRLTYPLFTGGRLAANRHEARADVSAALANAALTESRLARRIALAWFNVHRENQNVINTQARLVLAQQFAELIRERARRGLSARIELESAISDVRELTRQIKQHQANRHSEWILLASARGLSEIPVQPQWASYTDSARLGESIAQLRRFANEQALPKQRQHQVLAAKARVRSAGAAGKPNVSLFAQYNAAGRSNGTEWLPYDNVRASDLVFGARLEWNLYDGGQTRYEVQEKAAQLQRLELQRKEMLRRRQFAVAAARQQLKARREQLAAINSGLPLIARRLEIAKVRLKAGRTDSRSIIQLERERQLLTGRLRLAQLDLLQAHTHLLFARSLPSAAVATDR